MDKQKNSINMMKLVRNLADEFNNVQLENCLQQAIAGNINSCFISDSIDEPGTDYAISVLAKAGYVAGLMANGMSLNNSVRELGKQMRVFSTGME